MNNAKEEAIKLIEGLDSNCTLEDIQYHLYVKQSVEEGFRALEDGEHLTHEEVKKKLSKWLND